VLALHLFDSRLFIFFVCLFFYLIFDVIYTIHFSIYFKWTYNIFLGFICDEFHAD